MLTVNDYSLRRILGNRVFWFSLAPVFSSGLGLLSVPISVWIFSAGDIGRNSVFQNVLGMAVLLTPLGLDQYFLRSYYSAKDKCCYFFMAWAPGFLGLLVASLISFFFWRSASVYLYGREDFLLFFLTVFAFFLNHFLRFSTVLLRLEGQAIGFFATQVIPKIFYVGILFLINYYSRDKDFSFLLGLSVATLALGLLIAVSISRKYWRTLRFDFYLLSNGLGFGLPLLFSGLLYWCIGALPVFFLRAYSGFDELAIYSVAVTFGAVGVVFQSVFMTTFTPAIYRDIDGENSRIRFRAFLLFSVLLAVVLFLLFGSFSWVLNYVLPVKYYGVTYYFLMCSMAPLLVTVSDVASVGINISGKTGYSALVSLGAAALNFVLCFFVVPVAGAKGAAIVTAFSFLLYSVARVELARKLWFDIDRSLVYSLFFIMFALGVGVSIFSYPRFYMFFLFLLIGFLFFGRRWIVRVVREVLSV